MGASKVCNTWYQRTIPFSRQYFEKDMATKRPGDDGEPIVSKGLQRTNWNMDHIQEDFGLAIDLITMVDWNSNSKDFSS